MQFGLIYISNSIVNWEDKSEIKPRIEICKVNSFTRISTKISNVLVFVLFKRS